MVCKEVACGLSTGEQHSPYSSPSVHLLPTFKLGPKLCSVQKCLLVLIKVRLRVTAPVAEKRPSDHWWKWR